MKPKAKVGQAPSRTVVADDPRDRRGILKRVGGSASDTWNQVLANQVIQALWFGDCTEEDRDELTRAAIAGMYGIAPRDELEGMLAAQLIAVHNAAMECHRRAMAGGQHEVIRDENLKHASKLSRTYALLLEALNHHRGKGQQKVTVEHVHVHQGGQAIVGNVAPRGVLENKDQTNALIKTSPTVKAITQKLEVVQTPQTHGKKQNSKGRRSPQG